MSEANEAKRSVVIGLAGFGTVGGAVYDVLKENAAVLTQRSGVQFRPWCAAVSRRPAPRWAPKPP